MDNRPIGIFDSGVGGLSVLLEVKRLLPKETFVYIGDQAYVPYGGKTKAELIERVTKVMRYFLQKDVKAVILACNTATVYAIDEMRELFQVPIIGTVPVVKTLARITKSGKTAVFSTPATAKSEYLDELIQKFAPHIEVLRVGGTGLEELIEEGELDAPEIENVLISNLSPLVQKGVDAIALGCTHYPFVKDKVQKIVGKKIAVVDSGEAIARRTGEILQGNGALSYEKGSDWYYTTGNAEKFKRVAETLMHTKLENVARIDL